MELKVENDNQYPWSCRSYCGNLYFAQALNCPVAIHHLDAEMLTNNTKKF